MNQYAPPRNKLLCPKNWAAYVSMEINSMNNWHPWQLKKIKILVAVLELAARQHWQSSPFTQKIGQIGGAA